MYINLEYNNEDAVVSYAVGELVNHLGMVNAPVMFFSNNNYEVVCDEVCCKKTKADFAIKLAVESGLEKYGLNKVANSYEDDQYVCSIKKDGGVILGSNARSVLLCVYALLHKMGFRFLRPGEHGTILPEKVTAEMIFTEFSATAAARHRGVCIEGANSVQNILDFIEWLPKLGYNGFFMQFKNADTFIKRWDEHLFNPLLKHENMSAEDYIEADEKITELMGKCGLLHHRVGHGFIGMAIGNDTIGWDENTAAPDESTAQLLALIDGKREFFGGIPTDTSLCYSNPAVVRRLTDCVANYAQKNQYVDYLHFWLADAFNNICECDECAKTSISDQYVNILNSIDEELTSRNLDTKIVFLLYHELLYPPKTAQIKNQSRFVMMFAPISRTFEHSYLADLQEVVLPKYVTNKMKQPVGIDINVAFLKAWQKCFYGDSFVYDYPLGRAHYGDLGYTKIAKVLFEDIHALKSLRLNGYISCQQLRTFSPSALPNYVMGLALFDKSLEFDDIVEEYSKSAYGEDWEKAKTYLEEVSALCDTDYANGKTERISLDISHMYTRLVKVIENFRPVILDNLKHAGDPQKFYWEVLDFHSNYSIILCKAISALAGGDTKTSEILYAEFKEYICENELKYQSSLDVFRIQEVSMHYTGLPA